jgi:hypothetical protein
VALPRVRRRAGRATQAQWRTEESEFVDPVAGQLLQERDLYHRRAHLGEQIEVHRQEVSGHVGRRLVLDGGLISGLALTRGSAKRRAPRNDKR